jgi:hypothetical protein
MNLEAELDELLRDAGWAGMSWHALTTKYAKVGTADLKTALDHLIAMRSIYRFLRPHGTGRTAAASTKLFLLARDHLADAIAERACRSAERPMTEGDSIIIATAILVMGVLIVGVIGYAAQRQEARRTRL